MCGIGVIHNLRRERVCVDDLRAMCSVIQHRGPDCAGYALQDNGSVGLSHVRLSIIDLVTGDQPLSTPDGQVTVVFNGELYDYQRHRDALERAGHQFQTTSDTEVLLHLYLESGTDSFAQLNGEYAFVIWDGRTKRLIAARDRFGVKPLFIHRTSDELFVVSEMKSLFALPRIERAFDPDFFVSGFFGTLTPANHFYRNIHPLPPGCYVCIEDGQWNEPVPYWTPSFDVRPEMTLEEAAAGVRERFVQAVTRRMVADVPVGSYLSGGIDSTLVCGVMSQQTDKLRCFNIGFENTIYDESSLAAKIASHYGAEFETIDCTSDRLADNFERTVWHVEQPLLNPNSIAKSILSSLVRDRGYKVCLTGEGADEVFGGYPYFKQELLWEMADSSEPAEVELARELLPKFERIEKRSEGFHWSRDIKGRGQLPSYLKRANFYYLRMVGSKRFVSPLFRKQLLRQATVRSPLEYFERNFDTDALRPLASFNATRLMTYQFLSQYVFPCVGDRVDMANSIECRVPFLDPELVEFVSQVPPQHFVNIRELKGKNLLRVGCRDLLPDFMENEYKHPFMSPNWFRLSQTRTGRELFPDLLSASTTRRVGVFRLGFVAVAKLLWKLLPQHSTLWRKVDTAMGQVLTIHLLHRLMIESPNRGDREFPLIDFTRRKN